MKVRSPHHQSKRNKAYKASGELSRVSFNYVCHFLPKNESEELRSNFMVEAIELPFLMAALWKNWPQRKMESTNVGRCAHFQHCGIIVSKRATRHVVKWIRQLVFIISSSSSSVIKLKRTINKCSCLPNDLATAVSEVKVCPHKSIFTFWKFSVDEVETLSLLCALRFTLCRHFCSWNEENTMRNGFNWVTLFCYAENLPKFIISYAVLLGVLWFLHRFRPSTKQ